MDGDRWKYSECEPSQTLREKEHQSRALKRERVASPTSQNTPTTGAVKIPVRDTEVQVSDYDAEAAPDGIWV